MIHIKSKIKKSKKKFSIITLARLKIIYYIKIGPGLKSLNLSSKQIHLAKNKDTVCLQKQHKE